MIPLHGVGYSSEDDVAYFMHFPDSVTYLHVGLSWTDMAEIKSTCPAIVIIAELSVGLVYILVFVSWLMGAAPFVGRLSTCWISAS